MTSKIPYQSIDQLISRHAQERGEKAYVIAAETGDRLSYAELDAVTNRICHFLAARAAKANERIAVLSDNCISQMCLYQGVQRYGATVSLVNCEVNAMNVEQILRDLEPKVVLWHHDLSSELQAIVKALGVENHRFGDLPAAGVDNEFFTLIEQLPASHCDERVGGPDDLTLINYTSGTTSRPKGVCCTNAGYFYCTDSEVYGFDITEQDRILDFRALTWCSPQLLVMTSPLQVGATGIMAKRFSVTHFFDWIRKYGATIAAGVPTTITMLLERPHDITKADLPTLRYVTTSSAPISPETYDAFERRYGITLFQFGGMTEAGTMFSNDPKAPRRGTVGKPLRNLVARFVDEDGHEVPRGVEGELVVDGPQMSYGYLLGPGEIQIRPAGGFLTGDLGYMDADGYVFITGRKKDLIIHGGINISPMEITTLLCEHPGVLEAATIGVPDHVYGEAAACFAVAKPGEKLAVEGLMAHLKTRLSDFKMPQSITLMPMLPKTDRAKVAKDALLQYWREHIAA